MNEDKDMETKPVIVYIAHGTLEAETVRLFLESEGIPAYVSQESAGVTFGLTIGPLGQAKVLVASEDQQKAVELLKDMEEGKFILPGDDIDPGYDEEAIEDEDLDE
jgi:hypothetical protein